MRVRIVWLCVSVFMLLGLALALPGRAMASSKGDDFAAVWDEVERLVSEDKMEAASAKAAILLDQARAAGDEEMWTRALVRAAQLRASLRKPEQAVLFLREEPWPTGAVHRAALDLFYAQALARYNRAYAWEISKREQVDSGGRIALDQWTARQISDAAHASCGHALSLREELGDVPVSTLSFWLDPGNYPPHIRGTLRDAVSYLCAGMLGETWSSTEREDLLKLDLPALIRGGTRGDEIDAVLADPAANPEARMGAVLSDLEAWHLAAGRREAALEARLERLRRLHEVFTDEEARGLILRDLEERLPAFRDLPWWSMGMATLAELMGKGEPTPGHLARIHAVAVAGRDAYPGSPGAARCLALAQQIEIPEYDLAVRQSDGLSRRSIQVTHRNLPSIHFRAYALDLERTFEERGGISQFGDGESLKALLAMAPVVSWQTPLPETLDFERHVTWVTPPLDRPGAYVVLASIREDFAEDRNTLIAAPLLLGDLVLLARPAGEGVEALALSGATGEPLAGVQVRLYVQDWTTRTARVESEAATGADGRVRFPEPRDTSFLLLGERGGEMAMAEDVQGVPVTEPDEPSTLLYTDRAVYRPLQTIQWKVLAYRGQRAKGRFGALAGETVTVRLRDANRQVVEEWTGVTNGFGTASGEIRIPGGRLLGLWSLESGVADSDGEQGQASVRVEEYKRPTFEAALQEAAEALRLGRPATLSGKAVYYFGLPVVHGTARWQVRRTANASWEWYRRHSRRYLPSRIVASGTSALSADGTFEIAFTPEPAPRADGGDGKLSYIFSVSAEVTDEGGETRTADRSFVLGPATVVATLWSDRGFLLADRPASVTAERRDPNGVPRPGTGTWTLLELRQPDHAFLPADEPEPAAEDGSFRTPGDGLRPRWSQPSPLHVALADWPSGSQVAGGALSHGPDGKAEVPLPPLRPGAYRLLYETVDGDGVRVEARLDLLAAAPRIPLALPAVLRGESRSVPVGGTARLLVHSGFPGQTFFFEVWHGGERIERRILRGGEAPSLVEIPIRRKHRGGLGFRLLLLRDHQIFDLEETVDVPWDDRELKVSFATVRDTLRPGGRETWRVTVRAPRGTTPEAAAAEVLAVMTDRGLDVFGAHAFPDPLALYPGLSWSPRASAMLATADLWRAFRSWPVAGAASLRAASLRYLDSFGIGGPARGRAEFGDLWVLDGVVQQSVLAIAEAPVLDERRISLGMVSIVNPNAPVYYDFDAFDEMRVASGAGPAPGPAVRANFAETAFWQPHLLTGRDGTATIEFTVPGSVTSWNVWVQAVTRDLRSGTLKKEVRSVRDLLARPYLPRFLREGDRAEIKVVLTNAAKKPLSGEVTLEIFDPETLKSRLADFGLAPGAARLPFTVAAEDGASVTFQVTAPQGAGDVAFRVLATAGDESDGELRPLPVLPSRVHLVQSRSAALRGPGQRVLRFEDLEKDGDPTRIDERMVVTLDAQLFQGALAALPYLATYPYECTEQTLNRFLSTGILTSLFDRYPAVARLAADLAKRETPLEAWDGADPNRLLGLEESPFLAASQGEAGGDLVRVLDPRIARAQHDTALAKLAQAQRPDGAFPWWPGGPASPYLTAYLLHGLARATEFGIDVPKGMVQQGWKHLAAYYRETYQKRLAESCCFEIPILINYVASAYPDPSWMGEALTEVERREILDESFGRWHELSPYLRSLVALTLKRMGRPEDAQLVFDSVMDSARTTDGEGTFWQPEERSWLWYNDTIESHAFALRTLMELRPDDPRRHGLVQWLFLNKKLNHWKSTRATAEVLYALVHYLQQEGQLGIRETATVRTGGQTTAFAFEPDRYTGKDNQVIIPGDKIDPARSEVVVEKTTPGFLFASATWHFSTDEPPAEGSGDGLFQVSRRYFLRLGKGEETVLKPLEEGTVLKPGDEVEIQLTLRSKAPAEYVHLRDPRPAGLEPGIVKSGWRWDLGLTRYEETRDSGTNFFFERLPAGEHTLRYLLRANLSGTFRVGPATVQSIYAPEFTAYSAGAVVRVGEDGN
jgi:alpha-2-macroglobulin